MKIVYISPGVGNTFYCQNCFRDSGLIKCLTDMGYDIVQVPMYLPTNLDYCETVEKTPVFFGAINVYLKEKISFYKYAPMWMERILDSKSLLKFIAGKAGSTKAEGLEEMTISMLRGEDGHQSSELENMVNYLKKEIKPDVVHLSNALLLGLAGRLKKVLDCKVVCSLQDENEWIDLMSLPYQQKIWDLMAKKAENVNLFITASEFYSKKSQKSMKISPKKIQVVNGGVDLRGYRLSPLSLDPPVLGYLCRMSEYFGLGILVDAFILLKQKEEFKKLKLHLSGGYNSEDRKHLKKMLNRIKELGYQNDVKIFKKFDEEARISFLQTLTLLSVPVLEGESFGAYMFEALAAGVPVVQPDVGCFPEFVKDTGGGLIYSPNTAEALAAALERLLKDPSRLKKVSLQGRESVLKNFSVEKMSREIVDSYKRLF